MMNGVPEEGRKPSLAHVRRNDDGSFAVERIKSVTPTELPYQIPLHFDFEAFVEDSLTVMQGPRIEVELAFEKQTAAWMKDRVWHPSQEVKRLPGGKLRMTLTVADSRELVGWIPSFGSGVRVVKPGRVK